MIDSGSAITTISPTVVQSLGLRTVPAEGNYTIRNADGSINHGGWTRNVRAIVDTGITRGLMDIAVVDTHEDKFLIGNDWLEQYKPTIDWTRGTLRKGGKEIAFKEWDADDERKEEWETRVYYHSDVDSGQSTEKEEEVETEEPAILPPEEDNAQGSTQIEPPVRFPAAMYEPPKPPTLYFVKQQGTWKFFQLGNKYRLTKDHHQWYDYNTLEEADAAEYEAMMRDITNGADATALQDEYGSLYASHLQVLQIQEHASSVPSPTFADALASVQAEIQGQMSVDAEGSDVTRRKKPSVPPKVGKPGHYSPDPLRVRKQKSGGSGNESNPVIRSIRVEWTPPSVHKGNNDSALAVQKQSVWPPSEISSYDRPRSN
ncbi:hypothetical protein ACEPAH_3242 [Sanghuangporus vaninii]